MANPPTILVVDDDPHILAVVQEVLEFAGYQVVTAAHGQEALRVLAAHPADLILLDLWMPVMDGWAFAEVYRQQPDPQAPIILLSASREVIAAAQHLKAAAYLPKPFALDSLLGLVAQYAPLPHLRV